MVEAGTFLSYDKLAYSGMKVGAAQVYMPFLVSCSQLFVDEVSVLRYTRGKRL